MIYKQVFLLLNKNENLRVFKTLLGKTEIVWLKKCNENVEDKLTEHFMSSVEKNSNQECKKLMSHKKIGKQFLSVQQTSMFCMTCVGTNECDGLPFQSRPAI